MKDPLSVSPSKGNQGTIRGKEKILLTSVGIELTTSGIRILPTELRGRTEKVGDDLGGESRRREGNGTYKCCAAYHYEHKWWNRGLTLKCKLKCYVKPMKDPLGVSPSKGKKGTTRGKEKILLIAVGIEPRTSGLDLPLLCRPSYEAGQRKSGRCRW